MTPVGGNLIGMALRRHNPAQAKRFVPSFAVADQQPFYIFHNTDGDGFVLVAGDERMGDILGYSAASDFDPADIPAGMAELLTYYTQVYVQTRQSDATVAAPRRSIAWRAVSPLLSTRWGQDRPYNADCPLVGNAYTLVGCGATAMAQVMKRHRHPQQGIGSYSYTTETEHLQESFDFESTTFAWSQMLNSYASNQSAPAVATLMHACGVSIAMDYTTYNSNSYMVDIPYALIHHFGYSDDVVCYMRDYFQADEWDRIIQRELLEGRPMIYRGADANDNNGHLFVVDGCNSSGFLHINWGWYGSSDGYFKLDNLAPTGYDYRFSHYMIAKISPESMDEHEDVFFADQFSAKRTNGNIEGTLKNVWCYANCTARTEPTTTFNGQMGMALYDLSGNALEVLEAYAINTRCLWGFSTINFSCSDTGFALDDGAYVLRPVVVANDGRITPIRTWEAASDSLFFVLQDGRADVMESLPDGISAPHASLAARPGATYTLDGRRAAALRQRNIYIRDGQKFIKN